MEGLNTEELNILIENNKRSFNGNFIYDGIVDISEYKNSDLKVLWILKEANSPDNYDWDMRDALLNLKNESGKGLKYGWANTFTPIVYTTYGIFNGQLWQNIESFNENQSIIDVLRKVAYINVKKVPGNSISNWQEIKAYYDENKKALHEQIKIIKPNIIIFGNTLGFFDADFFELFGDLKVNKENNSLHIYENNQYLLLHAYHPNNRNITQKEYCDSIIESVNEWKKSYLK